MCLWIFTYLCLFFGLRDLKPVWFKLRFFFTENRTILKLREATYHLKLLEEMLESGHVPEKEAWEKIEQFPKPWGEVLSRSVQDLRSEGAPVLPTLRRVVTTLDEQVDFILDAKAKSSQAVGQAFMGLGLIPVFAVALYWMLPGIEESKRSFFLLVLFTFLLSSISFLWMMAMVDRARFGNLPSENRHWLVSVHSTLERILALISTGNPPDLAWKTALEELSRSDQTLARSWKLQVWDSDFRIPARVVKESERIVLGVGLEVRKSIQTSLLEGRPCMDRIESVHRAFQVDLKSVISKELALLPNRCLKPLFVFVLPSVMLLLFGSFAISFQGYF